MDKSRHIKMCKISNLNHMIECVNYTRELQQQTRQIIGLLHGGYQKIPKHPYDQWNSSDNERLNCNIQLIPMMIHSSEEEELAEFRILNYKDRAIIRLMDNDKCIVFAMKQHHNNTHTNVVVDCPIYYTIDCNAILVLRGPVSIQHVIQRNDDDEIEDHEQQWMEDSGDNRTKAIVKFSGHVTLNITGFAYIDITNWQQGISIVLPNESRFSVERTIPYRFQQKTIVQRQKKKYQNTQGMMSLETFNDM